MGRGLDARHFDCTRCDTDMLQNAHVTRKLWLGVSDACASCNPVCDHKQHHLDPKVMRSRS